LLVLETSKRLLTVLIHQPFGVHPELGVPCDSLAPPLQFQPGAELSGDIPARLQVQSAATLWILIVLVTVPLAAWILTRAARPYGWLGRLVIVLIVLFGVVRTGWRFYFGAIERPFFLAAALNCGRHLTPWTLPELLSVFGGITTAAAALLGLATCAILFPPRDAEPGPEAVHRSLQTLQFLLYGSAALLAVSVLTVSAFYGWAVEQVSPDGQERARVMARAVTSFVGTNYSLSLAALYAPAAALLHWRGTRLAAAALPAEPAAKLEEWRKEHGLILALPQQLANPIAILVPFLAGSPVATWLSQ